MSPTPLSKTFCTVVEYTVISLVLSIPVSVVVLLVCSNVIIDSHSVHTVVDFVNDAS